MDKQVFKNIQYINGIVSLISTRRQPFSKILYHNQLLQYTNYRKDQC